MESLGPFEGIYRGSSEGDWLYTGLCKHLVGEALKEDWGISGSTSSPTGGVWIQHCCIGLGPIRFRVKGFLGQTSYLDLRENNCWSPKPPS